MTNADQITSLSMYFNANCKKNCQNDDRLFFILPYNIHFFKDLIPSSSKFYIIDILNYVISVNKIKVCMYGYMPIN